MTIQQLLGLSTEDLERMTDEELTKCLSPYFKMTRPEKETKSSSEPKQKRIKKTQSEADMMDLIMKKLEQRGLTLEEIE